MVYLPLRGWHFRKLIIVPMTLLTTDAAVSSRVSRWHAWLFRQRKYLPVPFIALGAWGMVWFGHPLQAGSRLRLLLDSVAWLLICSGEALRIWGVGHIGRKSRSSDIHASQLVAGGPYAYTRNPLYLGGVVLTVGLGLLSGSPWVVLGCLAYWAIIYGPIITAEEQFLRARFGPAYEAYCRAVPRWWPRLRHWSGASHARWRWRELAKEYQTIGAILGTALLINAALIGSAWWRRSLLR